MSDKRTILIGVAGGSSSGKTSVCERIMQQISDLVHLPSRVEMISMSSFYRELTEAEQAKAKSGMFNFDHPGAFDLDLMLATLQDARNGKSISIPVYDMSLNKSDPAQRRELALVDVLLVEGILLFYHRQVRDLFDVKLFVDCDSDTRLARRVRSDLAKGRNLEGILSYYSEYVKPAFEDFCLPTKKYADLVMPRGPDNSVAVDLMVLHIRDFMDGSHSACLLCPGQLSAKRGGRALARHKSESSSKLSRPH